MYMYIYIYNNIYIYMNVRISFVYRCIELQIPQLVILFHIFTNCHNPSDFLLGQQEVVRVLVDFTAEIDARNWVRR